VRETLLKPLKGIGRLLGRKPSDGGSSGERIVVRLGIPVLLGISIYVAVRVAKDVEKVPGVAFGNRFVFAAQLVLLIFYSVLLLVVPLIRAVVSGELPVELTLKGPRYTEKTLSSAGEELRSRVEEIEKLADRRDDERRKDDRIAAEGIKANAGALEEVVEQIDVLVADLAEQRRLTAQGIEALDREMRKLGERP
jgi:hypothetical protein